MQVEELGLAVGDKMQIQIGDNVEQRYPVSFIGIQPKGSVIISAPKTGKDKILFLREGQNITLRFMVKNVVSGFSTRVKLTRGQPYPYLHLDIPDDIQTVEIRKEVRVETDISATIINRTHESPALTTRVLNMSCSGMRIISTTKIAKLNNKVNITMPLIIHDVERLVTMDCEVSYVKDDEESENIYGLNIDDIDDDDELVLRGYIYQELLRGLHMI